MPEITTAAATMLPDHEPPKIWSVAAAYDAWLASDASAAAGRMPKIATSESR